MQVQHPRATDADGRPLPSSVTVPGHGNIVIDEDGYLATDDEAVATAARRALADAYDVEYTDDGDVVAGGVDAPFDPTDLTVDEVETRLADGEFTDAELDALADAEGDDGRTTALDAINEARE